MVLGTYYLTISKKGCKGEGKSFSSYEEVVIAYENKIEFLSPLKVNAIDTSGAGDTFDGAFLSRLASGYSPFDAGEYAVTAAGLSVKGYGAVKAIPARKTVLKENANK